MEESELHKLSLWNVEFLAHYQKHFRNSFDSFDTIRLKIITQFYPPDYAATGQLIEDLANQLGQQKMQVEVFTGQPGYAFDRHSAPATEQSENLLVRRSRASRVWPKRIRGKAISGFLFFLRAALHLLRRSRQFDILLLTTAPPFLPILGYFANLCFKLPYVCLLYDLYPDVATQLGVISNHHWLVKCWNYLNCQTWRRAQSIIVLSSTMRARIIEKCPEVEAKISVIHNWADPQQIVPRSKQSNWFAIEHNLAHQFTVLYSGNMGRCHDLETILAAAQHLKGEPVQFVFIGNGARRQFCIEQVAQFQLKNCLFLPYQDKQTLPYSLTACDVSLVSISHGMEGLVAHSKLYSAMASGRPVAAICESRSYLHHLIHQANCGAAFNNGDSLGLANFLYRLSRNPLLAKTLGEAGREYFQTHFTPELIGRRYFTLLSHLVEQPETQPIPTQAVSAIAKPPSH